ncbi:hypothetical protein QTG54_000740 [Skeletonema marinoi]|uniref:Uncharacterized protein n=1 Tax=Skeletonema marinoi TaxID=267567 RepID=A0AAD8YPH9_9STRA|nr:hypothetical protein QTG54_000740 [Skeletonema marinoi]|mmetsp:Transcript_0/g.2  ORF Transcript_0/g.2 Transcript_0/m.2 type:complete len:136 (-) Transcript_0:2449-2856(-)
MAKNHPQVFVGGDGTTKNISISSDKLKQKSRFSLNSIIDNLPKMCKDELCHGNDMDDTFSITSDGSTFNGLNSIHPDAFAAEVNVLNREVVKPVKEKKEKVPSPTGMMQSRTTNRRSVSRSPRVRQQKTVSRKKL